MKNYEKLNNAIHRLWKFVVLEHEGLSADEQAMLKNQCKIVNAVANELEDADFKDKTHRKIDKTIKAKFDEMMDRKSYDNFTKEIDIFIERSKNGKS
tara:strand:- start:2950 stop:3240 length:291 start_codon:yes stop_codon:yes gene_type:complete